MRRLLPALVAALCCAASLPSLAQAAPITPKKSIWGPVEVDGKSQFPMYRDLGAGIYHRTLDWYVVAPTRPINPTNPDDPAYQWPEVVDQALSEASKYKMEVSLAVIGTPPWANGQRDPSQAPTDASDYADFMEAAAKRYPDIDLWLAWVEPTKASNFQPLTRDNGKRLTGEGLEGPRKYAQMVDESYGRLKSISPQNKLIGGNTFTVGTVAPYRWIHALKLPNGKRPRMDMWGHNPFSARRPNLKDAQLGSGYSDFSDLDDLAKRLDRSFKRKKLKIFISEFSLPTDHANYEFNFFVTRKTQASWMRSALKIVRGYNRIYTFGYLSLYDDPVRPGGDQVERGLLERDGTRKPAYAAFRNG